MKIHIGKSKLHGKGLFASRDIKEGEIIFIIKGKKISFLIDSIKSAKNAGLNWVGIGKNKWVDPINHCVYFNHSCNPNSAIKGKVTVVATRSIKKDNEVTFDYSLNESDIFWSIKCNCGEKNCRKTIRSIQFLSKKDFNKYLSNIPIYYRRVFKNFNISNFKSFNDLATAWLSFIKKDYKV